MRAFVVAIAGILGCGAKPPDPSVSTASPSFDPPKTVVPSEPAPPVVPPPEAVVTPASTAAHAHAQQRTLGQAMPDEPNVHFVPITDAETSLAHFHAALRALEAGQDPDGKVRVVFYGSSSVAADRYTGYLRGYLQQRFGDGGIGFVAAAPLWRWHRHNEVAVTATKGWTIEHAQKKTLREGGLLGLIGAAQSATRKRVTTSIGPGGSESFTAYGDSRNVELHYLAQPGGGKFTLELGDRKLQTVSTKANEAELRVLVPKLPSLGEDDDLAPLRVRVAGDGEVRLFGASFERATPGVVLDSLGIGGTRAANLLAWDHASWAERLSARAPDLVVLAYGANECMDIAEPIDTYRTNLGAVLDRIADAAPGASCLLIGPVDFSEEDAETGTWSPRARLEPIIEAQREIAKQRGCGFFDTRAFMGGPGSMEAWVTAELAKADRLHMTKRGYLHLGRVLADALMRDLDG